MLKFPFMKFRKAIILIFILLAFFILIILGVFYAPATLFLKPNTVPGFSNTESFPGGKTSVSYLPFPSYMKPAENLPANRQANFHAGKALAHQPWIKAPTATDARDGLGPLYNARTCLSCHINGGRGLMPQDGKQLLFTNFLRLSLPGKDPIHGVVPEPIYGDQLQAQSTALAHQLRHVQPIYQPGDVRPEGYVHIDWQSQSFTYPDGRKVAMRQPKIRIENLGYGDLSPNTLMSLRNAPPIHGVGLIEQIPQVQIDALIDENDRDGDGISGRLNHVWDFETEQTVPGRFGLKANKASVRLQTAAALHGDMGIANPVFPTQPCTAAQKNCLKAPTGNDSDGLEINEKLMGLMVDFTRSLGVPKARNLKSDTAQLGRKLFYTTGCVKCHHPSFTTGKAPDYPHLSNQTIWPYSDFLLHEMGPALADNRPDYEASGSEWRTPPLWGVGLSQQVNGAGNFLHDGRARSIEEAILWHGGEAEDTKQAFIALDEAYRNALLTFVKSL